MKSLREDSFLARCLGRLASAIARYPRLFILPQIVLFIGSIVITVMCLQFDTDRDNLVGSNKKYHQNFLQFKREFPQQDELVVVVESGDIEKNRQFVERLGARLETARVTVPVPGTTQTVETNLFADIFYKGDMAM